VAMSINSLALVGVLRPSLLTRSRQVVSVRNALMTSDSVMLGNSMHLKGKCALGPFLSILVIECQHKWTHVNLWKKCKSSKKVCF
jgi:hypothetical protein